MAQLVRQPVVAEVNSGSLAAELAVDVPAESFLNVLQMLNYLELPAACCVTCEVFFHFDHFVTYSVRFLEVCVVAPNFKNTVKSPVSMRRNVRCCFFLISLCPKTERLVCFLLGTSTLWEKHLTPVSGSSW